jgi:hypothetical protein
VKESLNGLGWLAHDPLRDRCPRAAPNPCMRHTRDRARATSIGHRLLSVVMDGRHAACVALYEEEASHGQPRQTRPREEKAKENATQTGQQAGETGDRRETSGTATAYR